MLINKITGWVLLLTGLLIIFWALWSSFGIFTAKTLPPQIFLPQPKNKEETIPLSGTNRNLEEQMREIIKGQFKEIVPVEDLLKLFNLLSWSIFAGILIFGGARVSELGIRLIKK